VWIRTDRCPPVTKKGLLRAHRARGVLFSLPSLAIRLQGKGHAQAAGRVEELYSAPYQLVGAVGEGIGAAALPCSTSDYARSRAAGTQTHIL
jgi:hypothetical protein